VRPATLARRSWREATARRRVAALLDPGSFAEWLPPAARVVSPHLAALDLPVAFDDGAVVGQGLLGGRRVFAAAQEGAFLGGSVGEVHGAKLTGLLRRAARERPAGVLLLLDSGGVRLQEANAGLIAVSEVLRAVLEARVAGVPVVGLIGGAWGCFGGMGIVAACCDALAMSEEARLGVSGPDVLETVKGVEELDAADRALVWRTYGGKHRWLLGDADRLVADDTSAFRAAALALLEAPRPLELEPLEAQHRALAHRLAALGSVSDGREAWVALGVRDPDRVALLEPEELVRAEGARRGTR
jgi:malonate decarboxylase beta subunit